MRRCCQLTYFALALPWFVSWWGFSGYFHMLWYFIVLGGTFELNYKDILASIGTIRGVIHVGANVGQEASTYQDCCALLFVLSGPKS